jgi:SAM-dependent methyltransferase
LLIAMIRYLYKLTHDLLFKTINYNPFFKKYHNDKLIKKGFIADEHLADDSKDDNLCSELITEGINVSSHKIDTKGYHSYLKNADYPTSYYGGGLNPKDNFTEKTLEHYVCTEIIDFKPDTTFMDVAACTSPFYKIVEKLFDVKKSYQQDLIFKPGISGHQIGGDASQIPLPDNSIDAATLHCALEHFENDSDTGLFVEMSRILKPGGKLVILPFYIASEYTIHTDPVFNFLKFRNVQFDSKAQLRYCNWYQHHSRHYNIAALKSRILDKAPLLNLEVIRFENFREVDNSCYLRFAGVFTKKLN